MLHSHNSARATRRQPTCARCGKPLSDPVSVERGIGPECYQGHKSRDRADRTGNLFGQRANYDWGQEDGIVWIRDLGGDGPSVTNDMDAVLNDIAHQVGPDMKKARIMYMDSMGVWDRVTAEFAFAEADGHFRHTGKNSMTWGVAFSSLNEREFRAAKRKLILAK